MVSIIDAMLLPLIFYTIYKFAKFCWMRWFDKTLLYYSAKSDTDPLAPPVPFEFVHNGQRYKVFVTHHEMQNHMLGTKLSRSNVYINDKLVLMVSRMRKMILENRSVDMDLQYANDDIFKILKWARMHWRKRFYKEYIKETEGIKLIEN